MEARRIQLSLIPMPTAKTTRNTEDLRVEVCAATRTTRMLVAVLILFLITEFPQGILALLSDLLGEQFFIACYISLADLMDFVTLLNSAINFILYCAMSRQFRKEFCRVFLFDRFLTGDCNEIHLN